MKITGLALVSLVCILLLSGVMCGEEQVVAPTSTPTEVVPSPTVTKAQTHGKIAFASCRGDGGENYDIWVMDADGSNQTNLTNNQAWWDMYPSWSPDGSKIAFDSNRDGNWEIYVMNFDGTNQTRLTYEPGSDAGPDWSPDGSQIVFASRPNGYFDIYVMDADGSNRTNLTNSPTRSDKYPSWSPDGSKIAFYSDSDDNHEIYVMNADGSNQISLTAGTRPSWSPDGSKIAYNYDGDIWVMDADGSHRTNLTNSAGVDWNPPAWSPDGGRIVYCHVVAYGTTRCGAITDIYVMDADGSNNTNLTNSGVANLYPSWSP